MNIRIRLAAVAAILLFAGPASARFLSLDPVTVEDHGDTRHFNRYTYAYNNPYTFTDPDGRCPNCVTGLVGAGLGAGYGALSEGIRQWQAGDGFKPRAFFVESGKGALVGGAIGFTGGTAAASGLTLGGQMAATGSVGLGIGMGAHAAGEIAKGNPAPSPQESLVAGIATALGSRPTAAAIISGTAGGLVEEQVKQANSP